MVGALTLILLMFGSLIVAGVWVISYSRRKMGELDSLHYEDFPVVDGYTRQGHRWVAKYLVVQRGDETETIQVPLWEEAEPGQTVKLAVIEGQLSYESKAKYKHLIGLGVGLIVFGTALVVMVLFAAAGDLGLS